MTAHRAVSAWGVSVPPYPAARRLGLLGSALAPTLVLAGAALLVRGILGWALLAVATLAAATLAVRVRAGLPGRDTRPPRPGEADRFVSVVEGLASDLGVEAPAVSLIDAGGPNAFVFRARGRTCVAATRALVDSYTRTEQEAVAAHCLVRAASGSLRFSQLAVALGPWSYRMAPAVGSEHDAAAASVTRYPPALLDAIAKAEPASAAGPLAFVAESPTHVPAGERIAALRDL